MRGQRRIIRDLKREFGFPFTSQPTFAKWLRRTFKRSYERAVEGARKAPAAKVRLDDHVFARSDADVRSLEKATDFVITCAQNNTEPEWDFLRALERYAKERSARLVVIPMRYANPTSKRDPQEEKSEDYWWHEALHEYLVENELRIHPHLRIMGDVRIQATAVHPLSGLESRSRDASAIYGHPQLAMQSVATPQHRLPKLLYTTGSARFELDVSLDMVRGEVRAMALQSRFNRSGRPKGSDRARSGAPAEADCRGGMRARSPEPRDRRP